MNHFDDIWDNRFAALLLDSMAEGVFTLNAEGMIQSWNSSMERIAGYTAAEIGARVRKDSKTVNNRLSQLRQAFGEDVVPYRKSGKKPG